MALILPTNSHVLLMQIEAPNHHHLENQMSHSAAAEVAVSGQYYINLQT